MTINVPLGVGMYTDGVSGSELIAHAKRLEKLGYDSLWLPEMAGREPFSTSAYLLANTNTLRVNTGISNIYVRDANAAAQGANTLAEFSGGRFTLGLGVSHPHLVESRGHEWQPPLRKMRQYLQDGRAAVITAPKSSVPVPVIIAAHGPKLLQLAREQADGAMLYMQPAEAISNAREILGEDKQLCVVARCVRGENKQAARDIARKALAFYISLPAYHQAWVRLGFSESDWTEGGSDRLIDSICGCGDTADITAYLESLEAAGASCIVVSPMHPEEKYDGLNAAQLLWDWELLESLAAAA